MKDLLEPTLSLTGLSIEVETTHLQQSQLTSNPIPIGPGQGEIQIGAIPLIGRLVWSPLPKIR